MPNPNGGLDYANCVNQNPPNSVTFSHPLLPNLIHHFFFSITVLLCLPGTLYAAGYSCPAYKKYTSCNSGYYLNGTSAGNSCDTCPAGCTCAGGTNAPVCTPTCDAGYYLADNNTCVECDAGNYCPGDGTRNTCPHQTWSYNGASVCNNCPIDPIDGQPASGVMGHANDKTSPYYCWKTVSSDMQINMGRNPQTTATANCYWNGTNYALGGNNQWGCDGYHVIACAAGYYTPSPDEHWGTDCIPTDIGYYSAAGDIAQTACTNKPENSVYVGTGASGNNCEWKCASGYWRDNGACAQCPADFPLTDPVDSEYSDETSLNECWRNCNASDVPNSVAQTGWKEYGGLNTCAATECKPGFVLTDGACVAQICTAGITQLHLGTGITIPLFATKTTEHALHVGYNNAVCYGNLENGAAADTLNVNINGTIYHAVK